MTQAEAGGALLARAEGVVIAEVADDGGAAGPLALVDAEGNRIAVVRAVADGDEPDVTLSDGIGVRGSGDSSEQQALIEAREVLEIALDPDGTVALGTATAARLTLGYVNDASGDTASLRVEAYRGGQQVAATTLRFTESDSPPPIDFKPGTEFDTLRIMDGEPTLDLSFALHSAEFEVSGAPASPPPPPPPPPSAPASGDADSVFVGQSEPGSAIEARVDGRTVAESESTGEVDSPVVLRDSADVTIAEVRGLEGGARDLNVGDGIGVRGSGDDADQRAQVESSEVIEIKLDPNDELGLGTATRAVLQLGDVEDVSGSTASLRVMAYRDGEEVADTILRFSDGGDRTVTFDSPEQFDTLRVTDGEPDQDLSFVLHSAKFEVEGSDTVVSSPPPPPPPSSDIPSDAVRLTPNDDFNGIVADAAPGTTFALADGNYRGWDVSPKDGMQFIAEGDKAVLDGSRVVNGWSKSGSHWVADVGSPKYSDHGRADDPLAFHLNDLFLNDKLLEQVGSRGELGSGKWYRDGNRAYIADDPGGKVVEISRDSHAFDGSGDDVLLQGLTVRQYAQRAQKAAIDAEDGENWTLIDVTAEHNHARGLTVNDGMLVRGGSFSHNGQSGIGGGRVKDVTIEGTELAHNNYAGYDYWWEAAGIKLARSINTTIEDSLVHNNGGPGIWLDWDNVDALIEGNAVYDNLSMGIQFEASRDSVIRGNLAFSNGDDGFDVGFWSSEILVQSSGNTVVEDNVVASDFNEAIGILSHPRGGGDYGTHYARGNTIQDNEVINVVGNARVGAESTFDAQAVLDSTTVNGNTYYVTAGDADNRNWSTGFSGDHRDFDGIRKVGWETEGELIIVKDPEDRIPDPESFVGRTSVASASVQGDVSVQGDDTGEANGGGFVVFDGIAKLGNPLSVTLDDIFDSGAEMPLGGAETLATVPVGLDPTSLVLDSGEVITG